MSSTTYAIPPDHVAKGYRWDGKSWIEEPILPDGAFGAMGGLEPDDYFRDDERVRDYLARYGIARPRWDPPEPNDTAPEAEWGFDPTLLDSIHALARDCGWRVVTLDFENPEALSWLTAAVYRAWYRELGFDPKRLLNPGRFIGGI